MKTHPTPEEWMSFLYGEDAPPRHIELDSHLRDCAQCRQQVQQWRGSMSALDSWKVPQARRRVFARPAVQWAAAAAVVLGLGFGLGRMTSNPAPDLAQMKTELRAEMDNRLAAARDQLAQVWQLHQTEFAQAVQAGAADAVNEETTQLLERYVKALEERREADRSAYFAALKKLDERRQSEVASLRQDVATLAVNADDGFSRTREQLLQLAAATQPIPAPNP
jgi:hypothetical protein